MSYLFRSGFTHVLVNSRRHLQSQGLIECGYFPHKPFIYAYDNATLNLTFLISGEGNYEINGKTIFVKAPCVLIQKPGDQCRYGPVGHGRWEEFYLIYQPEELTRFSERYQLSEEEVYWPIHNQFTIENYIKGISDSIDRNQPVDVIEELCGLILVLSKMPKQANHQDKLVATIRDLAATVKKDSHIPLCFHQISQQIGLSYSSFRREWIKLYGVSPKIYQMDIRVTKAANLLINTNLSVATIAEQVGYTDAAYFSTLFKKRYQQNPLQYRKSRRNSPPALQ
ncbi:AraC family transcriptional regulator [Vibrio sp. WXL103]|uniref:AraC family transcriptional regulator n=1 Tax=Vibrio sp. WXL103 TaxID=3450710 RepID=UPI003EC705C1